MRPTTTPLNTIFALFYLLLLCVGCAGRSIPAPEVTSVVIDGEPSVYITLSDGGHAGVKGGVWGEVQIKDDLGADVVCPTLTLDLRLPSYGVDLYWTGVPPTGDVDGNGEPDIDAVCYERLGVFGPRLRPEAERASQGEQARDALAKIGSALWEFGLRLLPVIFERVLEVEQVQGDALARAD